MCIFCHGLWRRLKFPLCVTGPKLSGSAFWAINPKHKDERVFSMDNYRIMGHVYEVLVKLYSDKAVKNCRMAMLDDITPGDRVLFAGVGHGDDAIHAAKLGADVTVVDLSPTMLEKFRTNYTKAGVDSAIREVHGDIMAFNEFDGFDVVVANFFLNIFKFDMMLDVLEQLIALAKPGAQIVIGDFVHVSEENIVLRAIKKSYWLMAALIFYIFVKHPIHIAYNYPEHLKALGLTKQEIRYHAVHYLRLRWIECFWSIRAYKPHS